MWICDHFEELQAMFDAKDIDFDNYEGESSFHDATGAGRGYAVAGGVANAIEQCINEYYPDIDVKIEHAEGLADCKKFVDTCKGRQDEWMSDRRNGMSGRMCCRSGNESSGE